MPGVATTILIDGTPTNGADPWTDSLVAGGAWKDSNGGTVTINWTAFQGTMDGQNSYGWTPVALAGLREALSLWESVANIDFVEVASAADADAKFWWGTETQAGGADVLGWSELPGYSEAEALDVLFNAQDSALSGSLGKGSLGLVTMVHEIGHLLGLAHPHDGGAAPDATTFQGVDWWDPYATGSGALNQGIYTTMSYNFGWPVRLPDHTAESWGLQYGPMALDIIAIQAIYGANTTYASGDNVYVLPKTDGLGTYWSTIWDTGGVDTISNAGAAGNTTIDLLATTDGYGVIGDGAFSYNNGILIGGGYKIAQGVVIENAIGGNANDWLYGNAANNRLEGGNGQDQLDGREGADTMIGGAGGDYYYVDDSGDVIVELDTGSEIDTVISYVNYTLGANVENLTLAPNWGQINGKGNGSANIIIGNEYDNILEGAGGADTLNGRDGNDRLVVNDLSFANIDGGGGTDTLALGGAGLVLNLTNAATAAKLLGIERIDLTGTGNNTLVVSQTSVLNGIGAIVGGKRILVVEGNTGDKVQFAESNWANTGSFTNFDGTFDRWVLGNAEVHVEQVASPSGVTIVGTAGNDIISTTVTVSGQPLATSLGDIIDGGLGADTMAGGLGNDTYYVDTLLDVVIEEANAGRDKVIAGVSYVLGANVEDLTLAGAGHIDATGNALDNVLTGNAGNNALDGGSGADTMAGGLGDDTYYVDTLLDVVIEEANAGRDKVIAGVSYVLGVNVEDLTLAGTGHINATGNALDNVLTGNAGNNMLDGGAGADVFHAGEGDDRLTVKDLAFRLADGGAGIDTLALGGAGLSLNLGDPLIAAKLEGIERIDLTGTGNNTLVVSQLSVLGGVGAVAGGKHVLVVERNFGDTVQFAESGWTKSGSFTNGDGTFDRWVLGDAEVHVEQIASSPLPLRTILLSTLGSGTGFKLSGANNDLLGFAVASAGDINGDGFDDLILGVVYASPRGRASGASYVVFGTGSESVATIDVSTLNGSNGFKLSGEAAYDRSGRSVASAGDVNGDGFADVIIGAHGADPHGSYSGASYVVFGKASSFAANIDLSSLNGSNGFKLSDVTTDGRSGYSVASAGDVNGDGFDDMIVGATGITGGNSLSGGSYVVFGKASGFAANLDLSSLDGSNGFRLGGVRLFEQAGYSVASADVNGDGYADLIVGTLNRLGTSAGDVYVVFGKASGFTANVGLAGLDGANGFKLSGVSSLDASGSSVASAGDVNGDGFEDIIVGARNADPHGGSSGASYVVFGKASGFAPDINLATLDGSNGFKLSGRAAGDQSGYSVASAGDVNGDGFDDLIVGAPFVDTYGTDSGMSYVVFGKASGFTANLDLSTLDGNAGFRLAGSLDASTTQGDRSGRSVASAGDVNGDGFDDLIVGSPRAQPGRGYAGESYVVFGGAFGGTVTTTGTAVAEMLIGGRGNDVLAGGGGADAFNAGAGDDRLIVADTGFRVADGGAGTDTLALDGAGLLLDLTNPQIAARLDGIERIDITGSGNNTLLLDRLAVLGGVGGVTGGKHVLVLEGNAGDTVSLGAGDWTMAGSFTDATGTFDRYVLGNAEVDIERGISRATAPITGATIVGTAGNDVISTTVTVPGQPLATVLGDTIDGGAGADTMAGGLGNDTYYVDDLLDVVDEGSDAGLDTVHVQVDYTLGANVENLIQTGGASIAAIGNGLDNRLTGNSGDNMLAGGDGADQLIGGTGSDVLIGGLGADALSGGENADYLLIDSLDVAIGGTGFDSAFVQTGAAVTLDMGAASIEWVLGNAGNDIFNAASQTGAVYIYGQGGDDTLTGSAFGDYLDGGDGTDTLEGGGGADLMLGNGGSDILRGQGGDDSLIELGGDSQIDGGAGFDSLFVWSDTGLVLNLTTASIEWVQGSVLGDDNFNGSGNTVNTFLYGWGGNDRLRGGSGDDYIAGGAGNDILTGGAGNDTMIGEGGVDRYVYAAATWGSDTIHSFDPNGEKLDFRTVSGIDSFSDFTAYEWDPLGLGYNSTTLFYTSGGTTSAITLIGVQTASLSDADFLFA